MPIVRSDLLDLDVDKLFEEHSIDEVIEIEKILDNEIEKKHNALRSMVGDRYKDVLMASDAIKSMKTISQDIVDYIDKIMDTCENFIISPIPVGLEKTSVSQKQKNERSVIAQMRLAIFINEQIWIALDEQNNLEATQYYLLGQHIHIGLSLFKEEYLRNIPLLQQVKANLATLRSQIFERITEKLETVDITSQEISNNLNALIMLDNQSCNNLLDVYIKHRKVALNTVINSPYPNVRIHICSMVKCLITTICLLHDCFISYELGSKGLIWQLLDDIISQSSQMTMSKLSLPTSPLNAYIPEIIKQFRPKCTITSGNEILLKDAEQLVKNWLVSTQEMIKYGLDQSLQLITNIKGLHFTREESLKIELPNNWEHICAESYLPKKFTVWSYFFQDIVTSRCKDLITAKVLDKLKTLQHCLKTTLDKEITSDKSETDMRWLMWTEELNDINKTENNHKGLSMKTKGFSKCIVELCETMDRDYLELLEDVSQYLYGEEFQPNIDVNLAKERFDHKLVDKMEIENHLRAECVAMSTKISCYVKQISVDKNAVTKSIMCARFLEGVLQLCPHFEKCCTLNKSMENWQKISDTFNKTIHVLWQIWIQNVVKNTEIECKKLDNVSSCGMIGILTRWDEIEILEQTEEKVFRSQIKVPLKPSIILNNVLEKLNNSLSYILPHTLPKTVHLQFIEQNVTVILNHYKIRLVKDLNQKQALQFLFDVKFLTTFIIPRENVTLMNCSQEICDNLRSKIDPFDLDVFYSYLQNNVKKAVAQSQIIFGCLLPSSIHLATLGIAEKSKEQENHSILAFTVTSTSYWFPLLPISIPSQKVSGQQTSKKTSKDTLPKFEAKVESGLKKTDSGSLMKHSASSIFGGLASDWFS